jgi:hypothetical protein
MAYDVVPRVRIQTRVKVRFFQDSDIPRLEAGINEWLAQNTRREIIQIRQSSVTGTDERAEALVSIWYIED